MPMSERIIFQPYTVGKRGGLMPGKAVPCRNQEEAIRRAERALAGGQTAGAHVVRFLADEEAGDYGDLEYLAALGAVPESD